MEDILKGKEGEKLLRKKKVLEVGRNLGVGVSCDKRVNISLPLQCIAIS